MSEQNDRKGSKNKCKGASLKREKNMFLLKKYGFLTKGIRGVTSIMNVLFRAIHLYGLE